MTFTEAAEAVLRKVGKPLHYKKITQLAIEQNLLSHVGKTPEVTMSTRLATLAKKDRGEAAIVRVKPGVFGLRDWGNEVQADASEEPETDEAAEGAEASEGATPSASEKPARGEPAARDEVPATADEKERAARLAAAAQLFPQEDDDDEPVLGDKPVPAGTAAAAAGEGAAGEGGRRRRRRRRRGRGGERAEAGAGTGPGAEALEGDDEGDELPDGADESSGDRPSPVPPAAEGGDVEAGEELVPGVEPTPSPVSDDPTAEPLARVEPRREGRRDDRGRDDRGRDDRGRDEWRRDDRGRDDRGRDDRGRDEARVEGAPREEPGGRDAADLIVSLLTRRDDRQPVPIRALVDDAIRGGRLSGDVAVLVPALSAAARVDSARREARGERPRLRVVNGRVGLVDWAVGPELVRAEADALVALERLRDGARRQFIRRLNELPQPAFTELVVLLLEKMGVSSIRSVRRPGLPQGEVHLTGVARRATEELRLALFIKRGGEIGRERVIELRGSLHHYGPATAGWIVTTGNVLSGARDEAQQAGTAPVSLIDGATLGRLFDEHGVGVRHATVAIPYVDLDLFDALRTSG